MKNLLFIRNTTVAQTRNETLDGKEYLVVPCVMIVEGVHNGSQGALFYSNDELSKFVCCWNMKPALLRHPDIEDSGTNLDVLKNQGVGMLLNTKFEDGKLKTEVWVDVEKANQLDSRVVERIENNEKIEVSTGLFTEFDMVPGTWNEEDFVSSTLNYRPDHLAILLDATGACSVEDGAGMLQNKDKDGKKIENEISHGTIRDRLHSLIREMNTDDNKWPWVMDVFNNYFVYELGDEFFKQDYSVSSDDEVTLQGESVEVQREVEYKPVIKNQEVEVKRDEVIASLIANGKFNDGDQDFLKGLTDDQLGQLTANVEISKTEEEESVENKEVVVSKTPVASSQVVANHVSKNDVTVESYLQSAPPEVQAVLNSGLALLKSRKTEAIETITANEANTFTKEDLETKTIEELEMIANLAKKPTSTPGTEESVENSDLPVLDIQTIYAGQPDSASTVDNEDLPTLNTQPLFEETK